MKRLGAVIVAALLLVPVTGFAQGGTTIEIGTGVGAGILTNGGTLTSIGAPGGGVFGQAPIYASFFVSNSVMIQPEMALTILSGGGETITTLGAAANVGYAFSGASGPSPYVAASGAVQYASAGGSSNSEFAAGGKVGYRVLVNSGFAASFEAGFRRWFDSSVNEITIALRLGGIVSGSQ